VQRFADSPPPRFLHTFTIRIQIDGKYDGLSRNLDKNPLITEKTDFISERETKAMKKTALTLTLTLALLFSMVSVAGLMQVAYAQFEGLPYNPPIVTVLSPSPNGTYNQPNIPLNVTVQIRGFIYHNTETLRWLNYSLDGQTAIPMTLVVPSDLTPPYYVRGNDVLTGLSDGTHNITIYGETAISGLTGNFNATVSFKVETSNTPSGDSFSTTVVAVASIVAAVVVAGLLVYLKKRKH
jgi:hypothetical protein